jgi:hypothetical protein
VTWTVVLDPPAVASGAPGFRTQLDLNSGPIRVDQKGLDWGDSQIQTYLADRRVGSIKIDFRMPNRKVTIPLFLMDDDTPGGTGLSEEQARAMLQEKVGLIQMRGGWLMRQRTGGAPTYTDVIDAVLTLPDVWGETGGIETNVNLILECSPDFYGDPITLDSATVTAGQLTGPLQDSGSNAAIAGDHLARTEIHVTDTSGADQVSLIWGFRATYFDTASTAQLTYQAENLGTLSPATATTVAGRVGVQNANLTTGWSPILNTNIGGASPMTHLGSYRVRVRAYTTSTTSVWLRFIWGVGAAIGLVTNSIVLMPGINNFFIVDLGEIRVDWPPVGQVRWEGQVQAMGANGGENIFIDQVYLQPLDDGAGFAIANPSVTVLSSPVAADTFDQGPGDLNGKTAPQGGTWVEPVAGVTAPAGPLVPTVISNIPAGSTGTHGWFVPIPSFAQVTLLTNQVSSYLAGSGFGFAVPPTATITGVSLQIGKAAALGTTIFDTNMPSTAVAPGVLLQNNGVALGTDHAVGGVWPAAGPNPATVFNYGGPTDKWGASLTPAIVNSSGFGFLFSAYQGPGSGGGSATLTNPTMTVYYTVSGSLNFQTGTGAAVRSLADNKSHFAILGSAQAATDVSADIGFGAVGSATQSAGLVARYVNSTNYLYAYLSVYTSGGTPAAIIQFGSYVAGVPVGYGSASPAFPGLLPNTFNFRLVVTPNGQATVYVNGVPQLSATDARMAAGNALASGKMGLFQPSNVNSITTQWDNFVAYATSNTDAAVFGGASAALRYDGMYRADPSNVYYGPIAQVVGDLPRLPPSGVEGRPVELFLLLSEGDLKSKPDLSLGSFTAQVTYRPVRIHRS